jgi:hypothetical protein
MEQLVRQIPVSRDDLAAMVADAAYVRPVSSEGKTIYAIHGADGRPLAAAPTRALAFVVIRQNDLDPADAH